MSWNAGRCFLMFAAFAVAAVPVAPSDEPRPIPATIPVDAGRTVCRVTRYMTGACLEDVTHEVYGGLYSQMVFGESFQEPPRPPAVKGFTAFGPWEVKDGIAAVAAGPGPKLISDRPAFGDGEVTAEVFLPGKGGGVAGLILAVKDAGPGMDQFTGYEVSLSADPQHLLLGRHRQNWEPIKTVPCPVPADKWISLTVRRKGAMIEALVDGKSVLTHADKDHPLGSGTVALRPFARPAKFRNLTVKTGDKPTSLPLVAEPRWDAGVSGMRRGTKTGTAAGSFALEAAEPFVGRQSQRITFEKGDGEFGIESRGPNRWGDGVPGRRTLRGLPLAPDRAGHRGRRRPGERDRGEGLRPHPDRGAGRRVEAVRLRPHPGRDRPGRAAGGPAGPARSGSGTPSSSPAGGGGSRGSRSAGTWPRP